MGFTLTLSLAPSLTRAPAFGCGRKLTCAHVLSRSRHHCKYISARPWFLSALRLIDDDWRGSRLAPVPLSGRPKIDYCWLANSLVVIVVVVDLKTYLQPVRPFSVVPRGRDTNRTWPPTAARVTKSLQHPLAAHGRRAHTIGAQFWAQSWLRPRQRGARASHVPEPNGNPKALT